MLNQIQAIYCSIKAAKARSDALVEEGRQLTGWHRSGKKRQNKGQESLLQPAAIQAGDRSLPLSCCSGNAQT
jgi:hypothetical protein